jgi:hypothetical protein
MSALYQENKIAPDTFHKSGQDFTVAESLDIDLSKAASVAFANFVG